MVGPQLPFQFFNRVFGFRQSRACHFAVIFDGYNLTPAPERLFDGGHIINRGGAYAQVAHNVGNKSSGLRL
jgi:hypothetical protein